MYGDMFKGLFEFIVVIIIIAAAGVIYFFTDILSTKDQEIISTQVIKPELRLTIKDNKVDTLYVYKLKK